MALSKKSNLLSWTLQLIAAVILFQTLFFKFTGADESVYIFTKLGLEPWGRVGSGAVELIAVVLLLIPSAATIGALLALGTISVAILSHLTKLGIAVVNSDGTSDGGLLFALALVVFLASAGVLWLRRREIPMLGAFFANDGAASAAAK